ELHRPPLLRVQIHHLEELLFHFGFGFHHSILDGWSVATMLSGLFRHYLFLVGAGPAPAEDPPPAVTYRDFVAAERRTLASEESRRYWRGVVGNGAGTLLPRLMPRRTGTEERDMRFHPVPVSPETSNALQRLARREGVPLKSVLLAAHLRVLALLTGELDVLTGLISNGRPEGEGGERLLGLFLNTVPLRGWLAGGTWLQLVHEVFEAERNQIPHRRFPLAELQRMAGGKLLETVFNYTHFHVYQSLSGLQGLDVVGREGFEEANFPFATNFSISAPGAPIELRIEFDAAELGEELLAAADRYYRGALDALVADPEARYELAPVMPAEERVQVLATGQGETAPVPACGIHEAFLVQAGRTPEAVAVLGEEWRLTYGDLAAAASRIAWHLIRLGVGAEARVAVCLRRSPEMLAAFLGVLETGAAYVPLDPAYPQERLALLLADSGATVLVSDQASATALPETAVRRVLLDRDREAIGREPAEPPAVCVEARSPAYVIYTSGSTGTPKGVVAVHGGLLNFAWAMAAALDLGPGCRILQFASPAFDASALQIFPALISGSTLVVHPDPAALSSDELLRLCEDQGVTLLDLPGALWRQWVEDMANRGLPLPVSINAYLTGGERLSEETLRRWAPLVDGGTRFLSSYGPTEATVTTTFLSFAAREVGELALPLPLGRPLPGTRVRLLDRHLEPVPAGTPGELYIGGAGLARGYLGRPGHTAERFLPDPFAAEPGERLYHTGDLARWVPSATGSAPERLVPGHRQLASAPRLEFLGRADQQVKIRGFRVEPGEVEAALSRHPAVREAVVVAHEDESAGRRLVAYFVTEPGAAPGIAELRSFLAGTLPEFLVPSVFVNLPEMPLLSSGKVDRRALPAPDGARPEVGEYAAPASPEEELLARIWAQVLRVDRVGVHDNFFELGGDSILSIQILARANQMGMRLTARQIFEHPTVAELARVAASAPLLVAEQGLVTGAVPMTPIQRWFFTEDFAEAHHFNQAVVLEIAAPLSPATLERAVAALIAHHDALRMRFPREDGVPRQENAGLDGAVPLAWIDLSALPAGSRAAARAAAQDAVQESFDLERGPLTRLAVFDAGVAGRRLLWATHHLVVDGVSWRLLVEDLETAYKLAAQGRPPVLPAKTTSFRAWAERLVGHARSGGFQGELPYWIDAVRRETPRLPVDFPGGWAANTVESGLTVGATLTPEETQTLLQEVPSVYRTQINDALLAALARAFADCTGSPSLLIDLEAHGREPLFDDVDLSRTVGWFTTHFPVRLDLDGASDAVGALLAVKEQLRRVPGHGIGHALLVHEGGPDAAPLRAAPPAQVSFNYLGQFDQMVAVETLFRLTREPAGATRNPRSHRT
ncbi:MAG TPA: amino acid adenylation domain-containing protein, partial [Thermoanaerobaculia bacterium]|nr:amino acid adenylation domain-containing protein [Thermoanaerobaculia bacterium]